MPDKTWSQLEAVIGDSFRKWRRSSPTLTYLFNKRSASKRNQTKEERSVSIDFGAWAEGRWRKVKLTMVREERAIDNLAKLARPSSGCGWQRYARSRRSSC